MPKLDVRLICFVLAGLLQMVLAPTHAQVTIRVSQIPVDTPAKDSIFIAGTFNNWNTRNSLYRLIQQADGAFAVTINSNLKYFEYKFTRGDWSTVEGGENGRAIGNRVFYSKDSVAAVDVIIKSWEDLEKVRIVVAGLPLNTPHEAAIYITGPFNRWNQADPKYKLERHDDGTYELNIPPETDTLDFKFTRGSWSAMESDESGRPVALRRLIRSEEKSQTLTMSINGWEDLSGKAVDFFNLLLAFASCLGLFAAIGLNMIQYSKKESNGFLTVGLIIISAMLMVKFLMNDRYVYHIVPKLVLLPSFLLFCFSPLLYFHLRKLLRPTLRLGIRDYFWYALPMLILLVVLLPQIATDNEQFVLKLLNQDLSLVFKLVAGLGLAFNIFYVVRLFHLLKQSGDADDMQEQQRRTYQMYATSLIMTFVTVVVIFSITYLASTPLLGWVSVDKGWAIENGNRLTWISICMFPVVTMWFALVKPEIFRLNVEAEKAKTKEVAHSLKLQLADLMEKKKPYLNPELTMNDLAETLQTNTHTLSRIINMGYSRNFYDFVNIYRIDEFKKRINKGHHRKQTLLSIAHEVGFSSKTTFNRTFKKITGKTPREYLNDIKAEEISVE
jgi:AraC-like DNA-binding protein